jgi:hypothetical protein
MLSQLLFTQSPEWVYQYVHASYTDEWPAAITIDNIGNTYTTGVICSDDTTGGHLTGIGIIKLNASGQERWIYFNDTLGRLNHGYDIAYKNKLYVTGYAEYFYPVHKFHHITLCLDTGGSVQWLCRDTINQGRGTAITLDSAGGVYAVGMCYGQATDIGVIKYDTLGNECWRYVYDGPASSYDDASVIVSDRWDNVYIGGYSTGDTTSSDFTIIKLDSAGNEKWVYRYDGPIHARDEITALAVDTFGNVYAGGSSGGDGWDICVVSVDSGGYERWVYRLDGLAPNGDDYANDLTIDNTGYVYVCGATKDDSIGMFTVVKLDTTGQEMWRYQSYGPLGYYGGAALRIALDTNGGIYSAGSFRNASGRGQIGAVKLSSDGDTIWTYVYPHQPVSPYSDATRGLAVDVTGAAYLTGSIQVDQWDRDIVVIKFAGQVSIREGYSEQGIKVSRLAKICRGGIRISGLERGELYIFDISGKSIIRQNLFGKHGYYFSLPAGVYFVVIKQGGEATKQKLIVVK